MKSIDPAVKQMIATTQPLVNLDDPSWQEQGTCQTQDVDPEIFYPDAAADAPRAIAVCGSCPVQTVCLIWAMAHKEQYGIWGGMTPADRRRLAHEGADITAVRAEQKKERDRTIVSMHRRRVSHTDIASHLGISSRTVVRVLAVHKSELSEKSRLRRQNQKAEQELAAQTG